MDAQRLDKILATFPRVSVALVGDFFLDKYLEIDPARTEISLETGLEARQIVRIRCYPGAAGTVLNNLVALGVGHLFPIGFTGADGEGFDLRRGLRQPGVDLSDLLETTDRMTPTYTKPLLVETGKPPREIERLDIKNRSPLPRPLEDEIIARMERRVEACDGLIVADQVEEANCGVVTDRVRDKIAQLGERWPGKVFFADSRKRIGLFRRVIVKPNRIEGVRSLGHGDDTAPPELIARRIAQRTARPACITLGAQGVLAFDGREDYHIPGYISEGPIDIVGAGDSLTAGMVSALCAGATLAEAALVGNLVASITIQQIGVTGTASPDQVRARFFEYRERFPDVCGKI
jgi:bifunctional ADP-heptose synthase (sugar kinase/adenylyltransferase)